LYEENRKNHLLLVLMFTANAENLASGNWSTGVGVGGKFQVRSSWNKISEPDQYKSLRSKIDSMMPRDAQSAKYDEERK